MYKIKQNVSGGNNKTNLLKRNLPLILLILLITDIVYSFVQHYRVPLDGDMSGIILPNEGYSYVLNDPFGLSVLLQDKVYAGPNRFFAHWSLSVYFKHIPLLLQNFLSPIDSVYAACALAKTVIQFFIIYMLAAYISGTGYFFRKKFLIAAILITPVFQTAGFNRQMGIIDLSITYTFFYALPLGLLLLFFYPFYKAAYFNTKANYNFALVVFLLVLAVVLSLNGPLIPGVVLIVCPLFLLYCWWNNLDQTASLPLHQRFFTAVNKIPHPVLFFFILLFILSFYSLYIGLNNYEGLVQTIPISERYARLPKGIFKQLTQKLGFILLIAMIIVNAVIIKKQKQDSEGEKLLTVLKWIGVFAALYIILLPLGGYRDYRPNIIRRDSIMPVTICLIYFYGISSYYLINHIQPPFRRRYLVGVIAFMVLFTISDKPIASNDDNTCERDALQQISQSAEKIVFLENDCTIMWWFKITDYKVSEQNAELLKHWRIIKEKKLYYQR